MRRYCNLKTISVETLLKYMDFLVVEVEDSIMENLPRRFALAFDGWSEDSTHFIGIFALFISDEGQRKKNLLTFTPLEDESD